MLTVDQTQSKSFTTLPKSIHMAIMLKQSPHFMDGETDFLREFSLSGVL